MTEVTTKQAVRGFADLVNRVHYARERITVTRRGEAVAVLVPLADLERLEPHANPISHNQQD